MAKPEIITKIEDLQSSVTPYISNGKIKLFNTNAQKPQFTIGSDDGWAGDYTILKPLLDSKGIKGCIALVSNYLGNTPTYMSLEQVKTLKNNGWEVLSHTVSHTYLGNLTNQDEIIYQLEHSKSVLNSHGLECESIVFPYSSYSALSKTLSKKYYRCSFTRGGYGQSIPIDTHGLGRVPFGADFPQYDFAFYKDKIDTAIANNQWLIFATHGNQLTQVEVDKLTQIIDYIKSLNGEFVTVKQALERFENIFESRDEETGKYTAIPKNGSIYSNNIVRDQYSISYGNSITVNSPISSFERDKTSVNVFSNADSAGFPDGAGVLYTYRDTQNLNDNLSYQMWIPYALSTIKFRRPSGETWGVWKTVGGTENNVTQIEAINARTANDLISTFPSGKITNTPISASGATTFPEGKAGLLVTNRAYSSDNGYQHQEYFIYGTNRRLYRFTTTGGAWGTWQELYYKPASLTYNVTSKTISAKTAIDVVIGFPLANVGDNILCQPSGDLEAGIIFSCIPYASGNVKLRLYNTTDASITTSAKDWVLRKIV